LAPVPASEPSSVQTSAARTGGSLAGRASDLLKQVPQARHLREQIRNRAAQLAARLDQSEVLMKHQIEAHARSVLADLGLPEAFLGWTMVAVATAFWRDQIVGIPYNRRLLLLPHCLRSAESCPAAYDQLGLVCQDCGACRLSSFRAMAQKRGYQVLIAEGSPVVMQMILAGRADALLGVACLNSLEGALDKILLAGIPCMAVPLLAATCRNTATDEDWVREMIETPYQPGARPMETQLHLLRCAAGMFEPAELERLVPRTRGGPALAETDGQGLAALDPVAAAEAIAYDFLLSGGKHFRPFITLAAYDAMTGGRGTGPDGAQAVALIPDAVKRIALAIEVFHKASLVHDDIEDDDDFRYGQVTIHRRFGTPTAINVGDYLIGLGYRIVTGQRGALSADVVADILARLADAHTRLCEGQGAELAWRAVGDKRLTPSDVLRIYALKTAPAFEAALYAGMRLAGPAETFRQGVARFARHLGVAFQILNDLDDWDGDHPNKRTRGGDLLGRRPTILWALALRSLPDSRQRQLQTLADESLPKEIRLQRLGEILEDLGVYQQAYALVAKHHQRAKAAAQQIGHARLGRLLGYLADTILKR